MVSQVISGAAAGHTLLVNQPVNGSESNQNYKNPVYHHADGFNKFKDKLKKGGYSIPECVHRI